MGFHSIRLHLSTTTEHISVSTNKPDCKNWSPGHNSRDSFSPEMILKRQEATEIFLEVPVGPPVKMTGPVPGVYPAASVVALQISWMMLLSLKKTWPSVALIWINHAVLRCSQLTSTQARLWTAVLIWSSSTQTLCWPAGFVVEARLARLCSVWEELPFTVRFCTVFSRVCSTENRCGGKTTFEFLVGF